MSSYALDRAFNSKISADQAPVNDLAALRKQRQTRARHWLALDRENEPKQKLNKVNVYEYKLSHTRSLATISKGADIELFQGSSMQRKKRSAEPASAPQSLSETAQANAAPDANVRGISKMADEVLRIKKIHSAKPVEHYLSRRTKVKVKEKMMSLYAASKYNFSFVTLTLVDDCTDTKAVKILNKFLTALRYHAQAFNYIWVAERQNNGRVHFHIIMDKRFEISRINALWAMQQYNAGLHHENFDLMQKNIGKNIRQLYRKGADGWRKIQEYLNPVDVIKCKTIDGVSAYLTNYVIKNETRMQCAVWHCNRAVSRLFTKQIISTHTFSETGYNKRNRRVTFNKKTKQHKLYINKTFVHQYGIINNIYNKRYYKKYLKELDLINKWILDEAEKKDEDRKIKQGISIPVSQYVDWQHNEKRDKYRSINQFFHSFIYKN